MTLQVFTARITSRDPDRFDITRKSGSIDGRVFAPSWELLNPMLDARRQAAKLTSDAHRLSLFPEPGSDPYAFMNEAGRILLEAWEAYEPSFIEEMRRSYREHRATWDWLLRRRRVVLVCYCADRATCHRGLLAGRILPALGAVDCGELPEAA